MAYVTVSRWHYDDRLDESALRRSAEDKLTQLKAMGASAGHLVRTGPSEGLVVVIYPDEGAWNRVRDFVHRMRAETHPATGGQVVEAAQGPALVSV